MACPKEAIQILAAKNPTVRKGGNDDGLANLHQLLQKSTQQYASDEVVKFGFCRGLEPVNYVNNILERFDHYKQFVVT